MTYHMTLLPRLSLNSFLIGVMKGNWFIKLFYQIIIMVHHIHNVHFFINLILNEILKLTKMEGTYTW